MLKTRSTELMLYIAIGIEQFVKHSNSKICLPNRDRRSVNVLYLGEARCASVLGYPTSWLFALLALAKLSRVEDCIVVRIVS